MKNNIFLRSTRRQPIRTVLLLLIITLITFAFTARAAEYLLVRQETERLGSYYKAIGKISRLEGSGTAPTASFDEVREFLENDPRVACTSWYRTCSAVLQGMYNADVSGFGVSDSCKTNLYFTGTLLAINEVTGKASELINASADVEWTLCCYFREEQSLAGAPELVWEGRIVKVYVPTEEAQAALDTLTVGKQYLLCARSEGTRQFTEDFFLDKPTMRKPQRGRPDWKVEEVEGGDQISARPLAKGAPLFYPVPDSGEIDWSDPALTGVEEELQVCREELSALMVHARQAMDIMPETQPDQDIYLVDGRWLTYEDTAAQNRVCVIHEEMANLRGLSIGDTITLKLRDVDDEYLWNGGYIGFPASGIVPPYGTATETFEIVGTYNFVHPALEGSWFTGHRNRIWIPESAVPDDFNAFAHLLNASSIYFALTSPKVTEEFLADTRDGLAAMALQVNMQDNGWEDFQTAIKPMLQSSLYNLIIFGLILLTALCLVAFFYLRARKRDVAIARALGVPAGVCVRQGALPLALIGLAGTAGGTVLGWQYALNRGAKTLASLSAYGEVAAEFALPRYWLAAIFGGILLLFFVLALGGMAYVSRKPTLELLQGNVQVKQKEETAAQMAALDAAPKVAGAGNVIGCRTGTFPAAPGMPAKRALGVAHTLRFVGCYIRRSKVKSALVLLLAALFTIGLAAIRLSILQSSARVDELFNTISVEMSLMRKNTSDYVMGGGFVAQKAVDNILSSGFAESAYLEGQCAVMSMQVTEESDSPDAPGTNSSWNLNGAAALMVSFSDLEKFQSVGSGSNVEISYFDGWDAGMFTKDWSGSGALPVLMPAPMYESMHIPPNGNVALDILWEDAHVFHVRVLKVAGTYTGALTINGDGSERLYLLTPAGVMENVMQNHIAYSTARFTLDSSWNRELDTVYTAVEEILEAPGAGLIPLRPMIWDEELTQAVEPLEDSIRLMEMLYPVALALSLLAALGVSALLILTEAREAAIMRVLGTTKLRSRIILVLQIIFVVLAGLMIGLAASFAWAGSMGLAWATAGLSLLCAAAYLLCAAVGSAAGAVIVTNRPPLELLQVKE